MPNKTFRALPPEKASVFFFLSTRANSSRLFLAVASMQPLTPVRPMNVYWRVAMATTTHLLWPTCSKRWESVTPTLRQWWEDCKGNQHADLLRLWGSTEFSPVLLFSTANFFKRKILPLQSGRNSLHHGPWSGNDEIYQRSIHPIHRCTNVLFYVVFFISCSTSVIVSVSVQVWATSNMATTLKPWMNTTKPWILTLIT